MSPPTLKLDRTRKAKAEEKAKDFIAIFLVDQLIITFKDAQYPVIIPVIRDIHIFHQVWIAKLYFHLV